MKIKLKLSTCIYLKNKKAHLSDMSVYPKIPEFSDKNRLLSINSNKINNFNNCLFFC